MCLHPPIPNQKGPLNSVAWKAQVLRDFAQQQRYTQATSAASSNNNMRVLQKQPNSHTHLAHTNVALQADMTWWICMGNGSSELSKGAHTGETERKNERKRGTNAGSAQCKRLHMVAKHALPHAHPARLMPTKHNVCCGPVGLSTPPVSFIADRKNKCCY